MDDEKLLEEIYKLRESVDITNELLKDIKNYLTKSNLDEIIYYIRSK